MPLWWKCSIIRTWRWRSTRSSHPQKPCESWSQFAKACRTRKSQFKLVVELPPWKIWVIWELGSSPEIGVDNIPNMSAISETPGSQTSANLERSHRSPHGFYKFHPMSVPKNAGHVPFSAWVAMAHVNPTQSNVWLSELFPLFPNPKVPSFFREKKHHKNPQFNTSPHSPAHEHTVPGNDITSVFTEFQTRLIWLSCESFFTSC